MQVGRKHQKSIEEYRHNIKLLKYHLKKQQRINETLKYKSMKNDKKAKFNPATDSKPKQRIYSMLQTVSKLSQRMKQMGLSLGDIFRMADAQYEGQINKGQFMKTVNQLKADIQDNLVQELFYAIDTNMNGILDEGEYLEFLCAYGGADSKDALKFQRKSLQKFAAQLKKKSIKPQAFLADAMDPISVYDFKKKLEAFTLNQNEKMILLKAFDPQNSGQISHQIFIQQTKSIKEKTQQTIKNQEMQKDIKHMCAKWRESKINPIKIFEEADTDKKDGISPLELEEAFIKLMPEETKFTIKKWVKLINLNNDSEITREQFTNSIRSFYALNQLQKFSADYEKENPNARRGIKNEQMPTEKILKKLGQKIQSQKMTKKQAFKAMDINGDGTLTKEELAEGLKKFGFHITDVGRILSVFDRDVSDGVDQVEWCKILGEDVEFEEVSSDDDASSSVQKSPKKVEKKVLKNTTKQNKQPDYKKQQKTKKPQIPTKKPDQPKKQESIKKPDTAKKTQPSQKLNQSNKKDSIQKSKQPSKVKPVQKVKQTMKQTKSKKKQKQKSPKKQESFEEEKEVQITEIEKQVGIEYKKHPSSVLQNFKKYNQKNKYVISLGNLKIVLKQMKVTFSEDQANKIFEDNIDGSGAMNYKDWLDKIADQYAGDVEQEKQLSPQKSPEKQISKQKLTIKKTQSKIMQSKVVLQKKSRDEKKGNHNSIKASKVSEKLQQSHSEFPNESDLKSVRSVRSVRSNPRNDVVVQKLTNCIEAPEQMQKLEKEYLPKAAQLKKSKKRFEDKGFPVDLNSITKTPNNSKIDNRVVKAKNLKWKHYSQFLNKPQLFQDGIQPNDILQGGLGNCYFLSALACLAEYPNLIQRLFEYSDLDSGYFLIWLCIDGVWRLYEVDGNIVVNPAGTQPNFTHSRQGQLWVVLLQKAYAKAYGCFENIIGGDTGNAIRDLTGSSSKYIPHEEVKSQDLWKQLVSANDNKFIMSAGTDTGKGPQVKIEGRQEGVTAQGLVLGHAYSILDIREEKKQKIIQLRNPWGKVEWTGDWSDNSPKWTQQMKQKLNYYGGQDGVFWMPFKDFFAKYKSTSINYLKPDYFYQSQTEHKAKNLLVKISHYELKHFYLGISQSDKRHKGKENKDEYVSVNMVSLVCEEGGEEAKVLRKVHDTTFVSVKEVHKDFQNLNENEEVVLLIKLAKETDINVSVYANCKTDFKVETLSDQDETRYLEGVAFLDDQKIQGSMQGFDFWSSWVGQKVFFCVRNTSSAKNKIKINFKNLNNLDLISPSKTKGEYTLTIQKGQVKSIRAQTKDMSKPSGFGQMDIGFP